jgi:hypothetical protein
MLNTIHPGYYYKHLLVWSINKDYNLKLIRNKK